ncbi:response regulator [Dinghuibacter sp.]|jgi:DNA-binding response OmpR family regulator|uniref:response regulator n=1 Tax=Dinghuibacter sp. TaxID=2024697 RepID=UPI0039C8A0CC
MSERCLTILVVDDYRPIVDRLKAQLEELEGVREVLTAGCCGEAVAVLETRIVDVVLLDIHLPDGSGIELLGHIKIAWPCAGVVMISNQINPTYVVLCREKGADYVIDKSNDYEMIPNLIATFSGCSGSTTQSLSH